MKFSARSFLIVGAVICFTGCGGAQPTPPAQSVGFTAATTVPDKATLFHRTGASLLFEANDAGSSGDFDLATLPSGPRYTLRTASRAPVGVAITSSRKTAYAWSEQYYGSTEAQLAMVDVAKGQIVHTLGTNGCGGELRLTPNESAAVAVDSCDNSLTVFSLTPLGIRARIALAGLSDATGLALDSKGKTAYVAGNNGMAIVDIPHARQTGSVVLPGGSCWTGAITGVALVEKLGRAYAATCDQSGDTPVVAVIDTRSRKMLKTLEVGSAKEWPIAVVASSRPYVYASVQNYDGLHGEIVAIDPRSNMVTKTESLPWSPQALAMSPTESAVFATTWQGTIWYDVGRSGLKGNEHGPVCCSTDDVGFGDFVR